MNSRDQSDAIWIRQQESSGKQFPSSIGSKSFSSGGFRGQSSFDFGTANNNNSKVDSIGNPRFGFARSMSVNSEGASTVSSSSTNASPPYSPIDSNRKGANFGGGLGGGGVGGGRYRTSSFSAGYGPSYGNDSLSGSDTSDPYLIHSPLSTSAPGRNADPRGFRRSNSISVGALEHSHNSGSFGNQRKASSALGGQPPLGPIEEYHKMATFGDAFKRSIDTIFSTPKNIQGGRFGGVGSSSAAAAASSNKEKKQMKDHVVSMLCESAIR